MTKEELALEFTKTLSPVINSNCSCSDTTDNNCCVVSDYYKTFLKMIENNESAYIR